MILNLVTPMLVALLAAFAASGVQRRLTPSWATWTLTLMAAVSALAVIWAVGVVAIGFALEQPTVSALLGWCKPFLTSHDRVSPLLGIGAWVAIVSMAWFCFRRLRRRRCATRDLLDEDVIDSPDPVAFAVPGRPGRIIVSTGMLDLLDPAEQRALFAHERSHLRHQHQWFLDVAETASAAVPVLRPLSDQVRFATERWADEDAAAAVGDRRLVATAIARAALAGGPMPSGVMGLMGHGTAARIEALLHPPRRTCTAVAGLVGLGAVLLSISLGGSTVQLHHLIEFVGHVCRIN